MEIGRSHLVRMIIMILLTLLANKVHCSTQPVDVSIPDPSFHPHSSFVGTPHYHFSPNQDHEEIKRGEKIWTCSATRQELLGKPLGEVVEAINQVEPSATIVVKKMDMPGTVLQQKRLDHAVLLFTDHSDFTVRICWP